MARPRLSLLNISYSIVGLAVAGGIAYYVWRTVKNRRFDGDAQAARGPEEDRLMEVRRSSRKAGRAVKDTGRQIGKTVKRGAEDVGEAFEDATSSGKALIEQETTGFKSSY